VHPVGLVPIGLILAEPISNAVNHGMMDDAPSRISEELKRKEPAQGMLVVADDGPGLPDEFDPATGRGMGLRVVKSMEPKMGGHLSWGRSDSGGAVFRVAFPLTDVVHLD